MKAREEFAKNQADLVGSNVYFLDEAGVDIAMSRASGWAPIGEVPVIERPLKGKRVSLLGAIGTKGPLALCILEDHTDGDKFIRYLREDLGPHLQEGDIVVMDGPKIHRVAGVAEALAERGARAVYLPAYSPEFNPIEMTWAWLKARLRRSPPRKLKLLKERALELWGQVTAALCNAWIHHCGYVQST